MILRENDGNDKAPAYLSMARAMVSDGSIHNSVFPMNLQNKFKVHDAPDWHVRPEEYYMAIDPAFAVGGDKCALAVAGVGRFSDGRRGVAIVHFKYLAIDGTTSVPVSEQLALQIEQVRREYGIPISHVGVDDTGTQMLSDFIETVANEYGVCRISFSSRATEDPVSADDPKPSNQVFGSLRTQMWMKAIEYGRFGQLKGLPPDAAEEFSMRMMQLKRLKEIESKKDLKKRASAGKSPDAADAVAMVLYMAFKFGLLPGDISMVGPGGTFARYGNQQPQTGQSADYIESDFSGEEDYSS